MTRRVVILAPEPIRPKMAGMGIRALELARTLRGEFDVRLLVGNDPAEAAAAAGDIPVVPAPPGGLAAAAVGADAAVVSGHAANWWFHQVPDVPVAADLYDPFFVENLHYAPTLGEETAVHDRATLSLALSRADFFLCASPEQRLFYAGALYAAGRIGPRNFPEDPVLAGLLAVVPFGVPAEPAAGDRAAGRRLLDVSPDVPLVLFGGIYDWYEPDLLLEAWPGVLRRCPDAKLLFFENPNPETTPQRVYARARERARAIDPQGKSVLFSPWRAYASRADLYAGVDLLASISTEGLERDLAFRTRLLDAAWGGVPSVSVAGGPLAKELEQAGAGRRVAGTASALAEAVIQMLSDREERGKASAAARRFAASRAWPAVAAPLAAWCREARVNPGRLPLPAGKESHSLWRRLRRKVR
ncbi:MAG TPA: glycosyltransferase [Thermoanaerobaculia bacterium]|nr:glycosyltransferase [Thermoanaerobaculia bacterium]